MRVASYAFYCDSDYSLSSIALKHIPKAKFVRLLFGNGNVIKKALLRYR